jgi:hypothetical protein
MEHDLPNELHQRKTPMSDKIHGFLPAVSAMPTNNQRLFLRYFFGTLIDLVVLGLFNEYWEHVQIPSFTTMLLAAVLLQFLLKLTIAIEHQVGAFFKARSGGFMTFMRYFGTWLVLFGSKLLMLWALGFVFGDKVHFGGAMHGVVALIAVVVAMLVAEELVLRIYRRIGGAGGERKA